jgi:hypothetical protein
MDRSSVFTALLATSTLVAVVLTAQAKPKARYDWTAVNPVVLCAVLAGAAVGRASRRLDSTPCGSSGTAAVARPGRGSARDDSPAGSPIEPSRVLAERCGG